ncbi:hypothetical protein ETD83_32955 [Actinomadura soli]|uniref:S-adenosyl methyltransferase n=1 Tax=Actinomadura soli TaxID=2508997 RepID=A0A5C4J2I2_9ACTN|nr:SAM-dependent methyltransferase [Actinomadura soli]TMQ90987.1 hypothetical protein ETD83_32955 [Actinomadura soli]
MTAGEATGGWPAIRCVAVDERVLLSGDVPWTAHDLAVPRGYEGLLALNLGIAGRLMDAALVVDPKVLPVLVGLRNAGLEVLVVPDGDRADPGREDVAVAAIVAAAGRPAEQICYVGVHGDVDVGPVVTAGMRAALVAPLWPDRPRPAPLLGEPAALRRRVPDGVAMIGDLSALSDLLADRGLAVNDQLMIGSAGFSWDPHLPIDPGFDWAAAKRDLFLPLDPTTPRMSRVWNALAGGRENYAADRNFSDWAGRAYPQLVTAGRHRLAFRTRAVRALVSEHGIGQLLVAGTDLPLREEVHEVAQQMVPTVRVVYADTDALVMMHARAWLSSPWEDTCINADPTDPAEALAAAKGLLDPAEPIGVLLINSLDPLPCAAAAQVMERLRAALSRGSYIAVCQLTGRASQGVAALGTLQDRPIPGLPHPRTPQDVQDLFAGVELVEPGVVPASRWRAEPFCSPPSEAFGQEPSDLWCGVGRVRAREGAR